MEQTPQYPENSGQTTPTVPDNDQNKISPEVKNGPLYPSKISIPVAEAKRIAGIAIPPMAEKLWPLILAVCAIFFGIVIFAIVQKFMEKPTPTQITVIVTPTPSPTPVRNMTTVATTSSFAAFDSAVASLSAKVQGYEENDPSLSPPSLVLPLGFTNE